MPNEREIWAEESETDGPELNLSFDEDDGSGDDIPDHVLAVPPSAPLTSRQKLEYRFAERRLKEELSDWDDWLD